MVAVVIKNALCRVFLPVSLVIGNLLIILSELIYEFQLPSFAPVLSLLYMLCWHFSIHCFHESELVTRYQVISIYIPVFHCTFSAATKVYLTLTVVVSLFFSIGQLGYQIAEHVISVDDHDYAQDCEAQNDNWRYWMRQAGFTRVPGNSTIGFRLMLPEVIALLSSLITLIVCLTKHESVDLNEPARPIQSQHSHVSNSGSGYARSIRSTGTGQYRILDAITPSLQRLSDILLTLFTVFIGIIQPSLLNAVYFVIFLVLLTWYSVYVPLGREKFNGFKKFLIGYSGAHLLLLYLYQVEFIKSFLSPDSFAARLIGLTDLVSSAECDSWWNLYFNSYWTAYANFIALLVYYFCAVSQYKWTRTGIRRLHDSIEDDASSDHEEVSLSFPLS